MVSAVVAAGTPLSSAESLGRFLSLVSPLLRDEGSEKRLDDESAALEEPVAIATEAAQQLQQLAMLVHLAKAEDTDDHFSLLLVAKSKFSEGEMKAIFRSCCRCNVSARETAATAAAAAAVAPLLHSYAVWPHASFSLAWSLRSSLRYEIL